MSDLAFRLKHQEISHSAGMWDLRLEASEALATKDATIEELREALERIEQWAQAYPVSAFPEPDFARVAAVLKDAGISLGSVSASNMRHVVQGVASIVRAALEASKP